MDKLAFLKI